MEAKAMDQELFLQNGIVDTSVERRIGIVIDADDQGKFAWRGLGENSLMALDLGLIQTSGDDRGPCSLKKMTTGSL
jgi:hypothetical protein